MSEINQTVVPGKTSKETKDRCKPQLAAVAAFRKFTKITLPLMLPELDAELLDGSHLKYIEHILTHKGVEYTVRYLKATQESVEHLVLGVPGNLVHEKVSIGKDSDGWPKWLGNRLKSSCLSDQLHSIRYVFTICSTRRLLTVPTKTNLSSITTAPTWTSQISLREILEDLGGADKDLFRPIRRPTIGDFETLKGDLITTYKVPKLQISLKSSPNGISFFSFPWDRAAVVSHELEDKLIAFAKSYFSGPVEDWLDEHLEPYEDLVDSNRQLHVGKISLTFETGKLKPRVFAIVDTVTQSLLGDLHHDLMTILRNIPEDCTFNQDKVREVARKQWIAGNRFYGFADLSNASDRLPAYLYEEVGNFARSGLGTAWVALFDRDFNISKSVVEAWDKQVKCPSSVRYRCGQPMGARSSWPFMGLVHHVLVWYSFGSRKASLGKYLLLGDDIVIFDESAYDKYCQVLDTLGCSYTHAVSNVGFEFAKRVFHKGAEVTGAYTQALWATRNTPELFTLEWRNLSSRGYNVGNDLHPVLRTLLKVSRKRFEWCRILMTVPHGTEISIQDLSRFCVQTSGRSSCLLEGANDARLVESVKAFRQVAALLIKQEFQDSLNAAKAAEEENRKEFREHFLVHSGLGDQLTPIVQTALEEVAEGQRTRIRLLERDLKLQYLNPSDRQLLRPNLLDVPRRIDFTQRDGFTQKMKHRAEHQKRIVQVLRV